MVSDVNKQFYLSSADGRESRPLTTLYTHEELIKDYAEAEFYGLQGTDSRDAAGLAWYRSMEHNQLTATPNFREITREDWPAIVDKIVENRHKPNRITYSTKSAEELMEGGMKCFDQLEAGGSNGYVSGAVLEAWDDIKPLLQGDGPEVNGIEVVGHQFIEWDFTKQAGNSERLPKGYCYQAQP